jgi:hypothetical protein
MAKKQLKTIVTYKEKESDLHDYVHSHSSPSGFIKDLIKIAKEKDEVYKTKLSRQSQKSDNKITDDIEVY